MADIKGSQWHRIWSFMWTGSSLLSLRRFTLCLLSWNMSSDCTFMLSWFLTFQETAYRQGAQLVQLPSCVLCSQVLNRPMGPGSLWRKSDLNWMGRKIGQSHTSFLPHWKELKTKQTHIKGKRWDGEKGAEFGADIGDSFKEESRAIGRAPMKLMPGNGWITQNCSKPNLECWRQQ